MKSRFFETELRYCPPWACTKVTISSRLKWFNLPEAKILFPSSALPSATISPPCISKFKPWAFNWAMISRFSGCAKNSWRLWTKVSPTPLISSNSSPVAAWSFSKFPKCFARSCAVFSPMFRMPRANSTLSKSWDLEAKIPSIMFVMTPSWKVLAFSFLIRSWSSSGKLSWSSSRMVWMVPCFLLASKICSNSTRRPKNISKTTATGM